MLGELIELHLQCLNPLITGLNIALERADAVLDSALILGAVLGLGRGARLVDLAEWERETQSSSNGWC